MIYNKFHFEVNTSILLNVSVWIMCIMSLTMSDNTNTTTTMFSHVLQGIIIKFVSGQQGRN